MLSPFHTLTPVSISNTVGCLRSDTVSHAVARTKNVTWINNKRLHNEVKDLHLDERYIRLLSQMPAEEIDETMTKTECLYFLVTLCIQIKKTTYIGERVCCQLRDFKFHCSSRSHKRSKFNSKRGCTFFPPCASRSTGSHSLKMCPCPTNLSLIYGIK